MTARNILQAAAGAESKLYVDDVFSTYLYDGNGTSQTINNGIDLAGKGGMVWVKVRSGTGNHYLYDTLRGINSSLGSDSTSGQATNANSLTGFNATGFSIGSYLSPSGSAMTSWTFRKAPKFFTHTTVSHTNGTQTNVDLSFLGTIGMVIAKRIDSADSWFVWHRSLTAGNNLQLESNSPQSTSAILSVSGTTAIIGAGGSGSTGTYVIYAWAHDTASDGMVQCGSFTGTSSISLGWEPQFLIVKNLSLAEDWYLIDSSLGFTTSSYQFLNPNLTAAESKNGTGISIASTGFSQSVAGASNYIYLAIRIPNKPPTSGTEVFQPVTYTGTNTDNRLVNTGIKTDMAWFRMRSGSGTGYEGFVVGDRLRGQGWLKTGSTQAETGTADGLDQQLVSGAEYGTAFSSMTGVWVGNNTGSSVTSANINANTTANNHIVEAFKRAPGFMDIVCYTGNGSSQVVSHQLGVTPEFLIVKRRSAASLNGWTVWHNSFSSSEYVYLNLSDVKSTSPSPWNATLPTSTGFTVGGFADTNFNAQGFVAYLFATLPGISKVGSYTGNGTSQTIDCGFTTGARFVLIKCTTASEHWMVWDTARGILSGTSFDPPLATSSTAAENEFGIQSWIDPANQGFTIPTSNGTVNGAGRSYIYLAIA